MSSEYNSDSEIFSEQSSLDSEDSDAEVYPAEYQSQPNTTEIQQLFLAVVEAITSLFKLSIAIRNPAPKDRYAKAASIAPYDDKPDISHVWEKFPYARRIPWLIDRLGKAIMRRRQFFRYREKHREKLGKELGQLERKNDTFKTTDRVEITSGTVQGSSTYIESYISGTTQSTQTMASTYVTKDQNTAEILAEKPESVTSYATSVNEDNQGTMAVPPPPKESANGAPFECPYCYTIQTVNNLNAWK